MPKLSLTLFAFMIMLLSCATFAFGKSETFFQVKDGVEYECRPAQRDVITDKDKYGMKKPNQNDGMKGPHKGNGKKGTEKPNQNDGMKGPHKGKGGKMGGNQFPWGDTELEVCFKASDDSCSGKCTTRSACSPHLHWDRKRCGKNKKCGCCSNPLNDDDSSNTRPNINMCFKRSKFCKKMGGTCENKETKCAGKWLPSFCKGKNCGCCIPEIPKEDDDDIDEDDEGELSAWGCAPADYTTCVHGSTESSCVSQEDYTGDLVCAWHDGACVGCNSFHGDKSLCNSQSNCAYRDHDETCGTIDDSSLSSPDYDSEGEACT